MGHLNACTGIAKVLKSRGNRIVFAINESWSGKLVKYGFEEELIKDPTRDSNEDMSLYWAKFFLKGEALLALEPINRFKSSGFFAHVIERAQMFEPAIEDIIRRCNPDVIVTDHVITILSVINSGKPWIMCCSNNILFYIDHENTPPFSSGNTSNYSQIILYSILVNKVPQR